MEMHLKSCTRQVLVFNDKRMHTWWTAGGHAGSARAPHDAADMAIGFLLVGLPPAPALPLASLEASSL